MMVRNFLCILLVLSMVGCGYTTGSLLPSNYRKIAVLPFQNKVTYINETIQGLYVPQLETNVRTAIIDRFLFDGHLRVAEPDKADLVLSGALIAFQLDDLRQDTNQNVQEYRARVTVSLTMTDTATGQVIWSEPSFSGETTYLTTGSQAITQSAAIDKALTDLATRVVERTVNYW